MPDLKPCPFCGKPAKTEALLFSDRIVMRVYCGGGCYVEQRDAVYSSADEGCTFGTVSRAMENAMCAWNWRVDNGRT